MRGRWRDVVVCRLKKHDLLRATLNSLLVVTAIVTCQELAPVADARHATYREQRSVESQDQRPVGATHLARTQSAANLPALRDNRGSGPYCGIYSLYICLSALGIKTNPGDFVSTKYVGSFRGSTAQELIDAARDFGAQANCFSHLTDRELRLVQTPMILHTRSTWADAGFNHWVAFLGCDGDQMRIVDAPHPVQAVSAAELLANWDGSAIAVSKGRVDEAFLLDGRIEYVVGAGWLLLALYGLRNALGGYSQLRVGVPLGVRAKALASHVAVILGLSLLLALGYHAFSGVGFLENPRAVAEVKRRHYSVDIPEVSLTETEREIRENEPLVLDARHVADYRRGSLPGAKSMSVDSRLFKRQELLSGVGKDKRIIVYCQSAACGYADEIARFLKFNGYTNLAIYRDGYRGWSRGRSASAKGVMP